MKWLKGGNIYLEDRILENGAIGFLNNTITAICSANEVPHNADVILLAPNHHVLPGMIDIHMHGIMGADAMDATTTSLTTISKALTYEDVSGFVLATMTEIPKKIHKALAAISQFKSPPNGAELLGIHLEGPFLSTKKAGAQNATLIQKPSVELFRQFESEKIKIVTVAPEEDKNFELIKYLKEKNIVSSAGHTQANYETTKNAIAAGITHTTHLFNAMIGIHHREPGAITACLLDDRVTLELIVDGIHLHPAIVKMIYQLCGAKRIILITDSIRAKGLANGEYDLGHSQKVLVENNVARLKDGTLAGSTLTMNQAIKNMIQFTGCSMREIVKMTAENPAKKLNVFDRMGSIAIGKKACFCLLDENLENTRQAVPI